MKVIKILFFPAYGAIKHKLKAWLAVLIILALGILLAIPQYVTLKKSWVKMYDGQVGTTIPHHLEVIKNIPDSEWQKLRDLGFKVEKGVPNFPEADYSVAHFISLESSALEKGEKQPAKVYFLIDSYNVKDKDAKPTYSADNFKNRENPHPHDMLLVFYRHRYAFSLPLKGATILRQYSKAVDFDFAPGDGRTAQDRFGYQIMALKTAESLATYPFNALIYDFLLPLIIITVTYFLGKMSRAVAIKPFFSMGAVTALMFAPIFFILLWIWPAVNFMYYYLVTFALYFLLCTMFHNQEESKAERETLEAEAASRAAVERAEAKIIAAERVEAKSITTEQSAAPVQQKPAAPESAAKSTPGEQVEDGKATDEPADK